MYLDTIIENKREEIKALTRADVQRSKPVLNPRYYLKEKPIIAEIKKASPSRGVIRNDIDVTALARFYEQGGAGAVSVLTDSRHFQGSFRYLSDIAKQVKLPLLCKDFILSEIQIDNAFAHGADFILLIAAALNIRELKILSARAARYSMKVLYEIHEPDEFEKIRCLDPELVGVNARDLKSFIIDREKAARTIDSLTGDFLIVAESGIETPEDIVRFKSAGAGAFLIGTSLVTADDPVAKLSEFYGAVR
ncbi:MAG: indole-3-glycerol-phosphate synthase [Spirochaetes bacterium]|nr:indole-3-glycerol-phosphate synthase [Spirochaetota bacterium]